MSGALLVAMMSLASGPAGAPAPSLASRLEIVSDSACPDAPMIRAALDGLGGAEPRRPARVQVRAQPEGLILEFQWDGEGATDRREVAASADCGERASAAATVAAAWLGVLPVSPPSSLSRPLAPLVVPATVAPAPSSVAERAALAPTRTAPPPWWVGVGLGAGVGGGIAVGGRLELARTPASGTGFGFLVGAETTLPRERAVAGGTSRWLRPALELAARGAWQGEHVGVALDLGAAGGVTVAWGRGYANDTRDAALAAGALAGLRVQFGQGTTQSQSWVELRGVKWLTAHRLRVDASSVAAVTAELPGFECFLTVGWSLRLS